MFESYLGEETALASIVKNPSTLLPSDKWVGTYKGWNLFRGERGTGKSTYGAYVATPQQKINGVWVEVVSGGKMGDYGSLDDLKSKIDKRIGTTPEQTASAWAKLIGGQQKINGVWVEVVSGGKMGQRMWNETGDVFSTNIRGQQASWSLWREDVGVKKVMPRYVWSARDPNPGLVHTQDYRITDQYKPPAGESVEESKAKAAEWAKQFALPSPEQQGENLARLIEQMQQQGRPAPGYDPVSTPAPLPKSKLPLIIGGVALVATVAALWWRFRK